MTKQDRTPEIKPSTVLHVYAAAAGRCSFLGCLDYVLKEPLTNQKAILGNVAHVVAASRKGTRGDHPLPLHKRSEFENLMLMCTKHHAFIDKKENERHYSVESLLQRKKEHESLMKLRTGAPATAKTHALRFFGQVRGNRFNISDAEINSAVFKHEKRYIDEKIFNINLINISDDGDKAYWKVGKDKIDQVLDQELMPMIESGDVERLSIFGLARIPLLAYLGHRLADKIPSTLYQKHKDDGEGWIWPQREQEVNFQRVDHGGTSGNKMGVLISISGGEVDKVKRVVKDGQIYEIRPIDETPRHTLLRSPKTLENFRRTYRDFLSHIESKHPQTKQIDCFIAGPAPVALICGRELRAEDPRVVIHDLMDGRYKSAITL